MQIWGVAVLFLLIQPSKAFCSEELKVGILDRQGAELP
jgi:hypothetical protein